MYLFILQILRRKKKKTDWTWVLIAKAQRRSIMRNEDDQDAVIWPTPRVDNKSQWTVTNLNMKRLLSQLFHRTLKDLITWKIFPDETDRERENTVD